MVKGTFIESERKPEGYNYESQHGKSVLVNSMETQGFPSVAYLHQGLYQVLGPG